MKSRPLARVFARAALVVLAMTIALSASAAFAASTYFDMSPAAGSVCTQPMPLIVVRVSDPAGISTGFQLKIDGVSRTPRVKWGPGNAYVEMTYQPTTALKNGNHTVYASVYTGAGRTSYTWNFTSKVVPTLGPLAPADNTTVASQKPTVSAVLVPNGVAIASYSMKVDGAAVTPTYNATTKLLAYTPTSNLSNDDVHTAEVTATDVTGATSTVAWSFTVQIYADMSDTAGCTDCHPDYPTQHPMDDCMACHAPEAPFSAYWNTDSTDPVHGPEMIADVDCSYCHSSVFPSVPTHVSNLPQAHYTTDSMSACPCHVRNLTNEHNRYLTESGEAFSCRTCHASTDPAVVAAIASGSTACGSCHTIAASHPYGDVDHIADVGEVADFSGKLCSACHEMDLMPEHEKTTSSSAGRGCDNCHPNPRDTFTTWGQSCSQVGCHPAGTSQAMHGNTAAAHTAPTPAQSCSDAACHPGDVSVLHLGAVTTVLGVERTSCSVCHQPTGTLSKDCVSCHPDRLDPHGYKADLHLAAPAPGVTISGQSFDVACASCHDQFELGPVHTTATCATCHTAAVPALKTDGGWDKGCAQANCHAGTSTVPMHADADTAHVMPAGNQATCISAGCHDAASTSVFEGRSIAAIHAGATTLVEGQTRTSCQICHASGVTPSADCVTCHADRLNAHGYPPEAHEASASCVLDCHTATTGLTELKPLHDATAASVACTDCHATLVPGFGDNWPVGWDKSCTACHDVAGLHPARVVEHTGTDVAYQAVSFFGSGCSDSTGHTGQSGCHTIANIALLHSTMEGEGCAVCHGAGKTSSKECYTCHKPGYATTYTVPGSASANITPYVYPSSDNYITPGWTYTTTPAAQPIYSVVNTPYPPATTTRFVTITSNTAGGVLFGYTPSPIPDNARIMDVRIYAKGKVTTATPARRMQGVFKIGGTEYLSAGTGTALTTAWTAGTGANYATTSTRVDFTRQPLYGETIWRNPKTGQDWTPAELNGTDPDSSLEAFGVNLTASATANNVSLSQIYVKITYYTVGESVTNPTVGTHVYHGDNVKYIHDKSDVPAGQRFAVNPAHGWYDALYYQDCYDFCHRGNGGDPVFSANQGTWMWYSVGGDPYDPIVATRTLTLRPVTIPAESPTLTFSTNYQLGTGASGTVEISTDGGTSWAPLTGTVGGASKSSLTGTATGWAAASYDLSAYAGQSARLRFRYVNGTSTLAGWAFDSLAISGANGTVFSDNAETLKTDWTNSYWTRSMGAFGYQ